MVTIGFIGLGIMGAPMTVNLLKAGFAVRGYDRDAGAVAKLAAAGGYGARSIADTVAGADIVVTMLPDSPHVQDVVLGEDGVLAHVKPGVLYIDMSSIRPDVSQRIAEACTACGVRALDAPVSGGEAGAINANLSIMVGGNEDDFAAAKDLFEAVGKTIVLTGPHGSGQTVKAANQLIVGGIFELVAEALVFLEAYGVDTEAAVKVLAGGLAGNRILDLKASSMRERNFAPGFRIDLHHKDMGIVMSAAREAGVVLPLGSLVAQLMQSARQNGDGGLDHSALLRGVLRLNGREL